MSKYKQDILLFLLEHKNEYLSGQKLANHFNISRTAIWKAIEGLKEQGFQFDSVKNKGYRIISLPNHWDRDLLTYMLKDSIFDRLFVYQQVSSTQTMAHELRLKYDEPLLILSEIQTEGRGRFKRQWLSQPHTGLWMSLVLHPYISFRQIATFNLFISIAIAETIKKVCHINPKIKWPNDIYIDDKKVCGFLTEINGNSDGVDTIICGIGININHEKNDFDSELSKTATSLMLECGSKIDRYIFLKSLIESVELYYRMFLDKPFSDIKDIYKDYSMIWDRTLRYTEGKKQIFGRAVDLKDDGVLVVLDESGQLHQFISADIEV
ncbi:biotin--[acetyl-CoA-carboxylase] ligase [Macrococcus equi]|uniref:biotin--[acetyl-CoA-carboxylase] ligase n=1 Tax=Macrococcus equi TaxID=3395462 RepID=UPI0039BE1717